MATRKLQRAHSADIHALHALLKERVKELQCLYGVSELIERPGVSLEEVLRGTVELVPPAMQYPAIASARLLLEDTAYETERFEETPWRCVAGISVDGEPSATLEICYLEDPGSGGADPFLSEERALVDVLAERIGTIIERFRAQHALRKSEEGFRQLVMGAFFGMSIVRNDQVVFRNPEQERLFGAMIDPAVPLALSSIHSEDQDRVLACYEKIASRDAQCADVTFRFHPPDQVTARTELRWGFCRISAGRYRGDDVVIISVMDITRLKELEQLVLIQDKMTSLGRVAAGMAHEIRNPLSGINISLATLERLFRGGADTAEHREIIGSVQAASKKIEGVVRRVMDFAKPHEPNLRLVAINKLVDDTTKLCAVSLRKHGVSLDVSLAPDVPLCQCDEPLIVQALVNLVTNAAEAFSETQKERHIRISTGCVGDRAYVEIEDSGPGIHTDLQERVFEPFYTTKSIGTGIGLSICRRIIEDHRGTLAIQTTELGGASFRIELPGGTTA